MDVPQVEGGGFFCCLFSIIYTFSVTHLLGDGLHRESLLYVTSRLASSVGARLLSGLCGDSILPAEALLHPHTSCFDDVRSGSKKLRRQSFTGICASSTPSAEE